MKALDEAFPDTPQLVFDTPEYIAAREQVEALSSAGFRYIYASRNDTLTPSEIEEKELTFLRALDDLEASIVASGGPFRLGEDFTGVDAEMIPVLERWRYQLPLSKGLNILEDRPALQKWFEAMEAFKPYSDRVGGDEYSWVATSSMFARYFGKGEDDEDTKNLIMRSDAAANALVDGFTDLNEEDCKAEFADSSVFVNSRIESPVIRHPKSVYSLLTKQRRTSSRIPLKSAPVKSSSAHFSAVTVHTTVSSISVKG